MRWHEQIAAKDRETRLPGFSDVVTRTFDAPEALSARFHEIQSKSALNKVPGGSKMPFGWTVNPYRGCLHACVFCADGETQILMGDGKTRRLAELKAGDEIYGTEVTDGRRIPAKTTVLDHWSTTKPAYATVLDDGTRLITSGEHRVLSPQGWLYVPELGVGDELVAVAEVGGAIRLRADVRVDSVERLGESRQLYDITTGTGDYIGNGVVHHNCFARPTHEYLDFNAGKDFDEQIIVKVNAPEVLRAELRRPSWKGEHIALGTNTDPYQWVEKRYGLTRAILEVLRDARNPCSVLTKSPLLLRDIELFQELMEVTDFSACLSIPTLDEKAWRATEPHTPHPRKRIEAVTALNAAGIPTGVLVAPLMPGINDSPEQVERVITACEEAGASHIGGTALHLRGSTKTVFMDWLQAQRPDLVPFYERIYGRRAYMSEHQKRTTEARLRQLTRTPRRDDIAKRFQRGSALDGDLSLNGLRQRWDRDAVDTAERAKPAEKRGSLF